MTPENLRPIKELSKPLKLLEILNNIYLKGLSGQLIRSTKAGFVTDLETTAGVLEVTLFKQRYKHPKYNFQYVFRLNHIGDETTPIDYYLGVEETNPIPEEPYLASLLFRNLELYFNEEKPISKKTRKKRVSTYIKKGVESTIDDLYTQMFS
jgi:hypothetical protein